MHRGTDGDRKRGERMNGAQLMTAGEVAKMLKVSESWVRQHANGHREPHLPCIKMGAVLRFNPREIEAFVDSQRQ